MKPLYGGEWDRGKIFEVISFCLELTVMMVTGWKRPTHFFFWYQKEASGKSEKLENEPTLKKRLERQKKRKWYTKPWENYISAQTLLQNEITWITNTRIQSDEVHSDNSVHTMCKLQHKQYICLFFFPPSTQTLCIDWHNECQLSSQKCLSYLWWWVWMSTVCPEE